MKQIENFPDYFINEIGEVWSNKFNKWRKLKLRLNNRGYLHVVLCKDGKRYPKYVHRLVALNLIPNPENLEQVNHINGIKTDNRLENLEWVTLLQNVQHSYDTGLNQGKKSEKHYKPKLTDQQIIEIREKYISWKYTIPKLAQEYKISQIVISHIVNYKIWKHI